MLLHTVNKSPFGHAAARRCLRFAAPGSSVLFIEDGVYAVLQGTAFSATLAARLGEVSLYALAPDLEARGFGPAQVHQGVRLVDYAGFVDLAAAHHAVQSWR